MKDWEVVSEKGKTQERLDVKIKEFEKSLKEGADYSEQYEELRVWSPLMSTQQLTYVEKLVWDYGVCD